MGRARRTATAGVGTVLVTLAALTTGCDAGTDRTQEPDVVLTGPGVELTYATAPVPED